jgi:hypothetical protein
MESLRFSSDCGPEAWIALLPALRRLERAPDLTFRIEKGTRVDSPIAFAALAAFGASRALENFTTHVQLDGDAAPFAWAAETAMGLGIGFYARNSKGPFACQRVHDYRIAGTFAEQSTNLLAEAAPGLSPSVRRLARFVLEELGVNIVQHSRRPETGWGVLLVDASAARLSFAFADQGVGFLRSLQGNPEYEGRVADDAEALQIALSPRVTGTTAPRTNMGIGLDQLVRFADLVGADLWIASGTAALHSRKTAAGVRTNAIRPTAGWSGAWISFDAPLQPS